MGCDGENACSETEEDGMEGRKKLGRVTQEGRAEFFRNLKKQSSETKDGKSCCAVRLVSMRGQPQGAAPSGQSATLRARKVSGRQPARKKFDHKYIFGQPGPP
jgi:hypothetical protein